MIFSYFFCGKNDQYTINLYGYIASINLIIDTFYVHSFIFKMESLGVFGRNVISAYWFYFLIKNMEVL